MGLFKHFTLNILSIKSYCHSCGAVPPANEAL